MDLKEIGWEGFDWIHLALYGDNWQAFVHEVINIRLP
jgi:hypothetical protein